MPHFTMIAGNMFTVEFNDQYLTMSDIARQLWEGVWSLHLHTTFRVLAETAGQDDRVKAKLAEYGTTYLKTT